jgi:hypothetical protein
MDPAPFSGFVPRQPFIHQNSGHQQQLNDVHEASQRVPALTSTTNPQRHYLQQQSPMIVAAQRNKPAYYFLSSHPPQLISNHEEPTYTLGLWVMGDLI